MTISLRYLGWTAAVGLGACGGGATEPAVPAGATLVVTIQNLRPLDPATEGRLEVWGVDAGGNRWSLGAITPGAPGTFSLGAGRSPVALEVSVEPPGDADAVPSDQLLLRGDLTGTRADLTVAGAVTQGRLTLKQEPGQFTMFTPSDNQENGYPSHEESGVWLFNMDPRNTPQNDMWVRLTQLRAGWVYEGWMVRDYGQPAAAWLSYGKFTPDQSGAVNTRDDTGWGPFSGDLQFQTAGEEEFPGDDWISNPLGFALPAGITLPLNLRETAPDGSFRWTHVITIEPAWNRGEAISTERPFPIAPYRDPFGGGGPGEARAITFRPDAVPTGTVTVR